MLKHRVIPCLLLKNRGLVKTLKFDKPKYVGDPINAIRIFNDKEVDELIVLDISASRENLEPDYSMIEEIAGECFMPLCYGGGIKSIEQVQRLFSLGIEKVSIQTITFEKMDIIEKIASQFGSQSVVVSIDIKKNLFGKHKLYRADTKRIIEKSWQQQLKDVINAGAGEVIINSVDLDGTLKGPDLSLIQEASSISSVPAIAMGGVSSLRDIKNLIRVGASAVSVGAFFVFHGPHRAVLITYPKYKELEELLKEEYL